MKKLLLLFTGIILSISSMATNDSLWVKGLVTNVANGTPIPSHTVAIEIDSSTNWFFTYFKNTDSTGRYSSHIPLNGPTGYIKIYVWDCHNVKHKETRYYNINSTDTLYQDFQICDSSGPCNAHYTYTPGSVHPQEVHFTDQSTGNIISWLWNFGDPSSGSANISTLQNPTHYFSVSGYYNVCLTVQGADSLCHDTYCSNILVDSITNNCHANFYYYSDSTGNTHEVHFVDISSGNPAHWHWNFGDPNSGSSNTSTLQNPVHVFTSHGTFTVCLIISGNSCSDTICKNVMIADSVAYHQLYGQVFAGNFPLQQGLAMIFSLDTSQNSLPYVNVSTIDSNGVYYFTQVPEGNYVILGIPVEPAGYLPTYFGDGITWEQATVIALGQPNNPYNIHLVAANPINSGDGSASGHINNGKFAESLINKIMMILLDANQHAIGFSRVTDNGSFDFSGLGYGTYYLHPEIAGITSDLVKIEISASKPHAEVVMTFTGDRILGINDNTAVINTVTLYPNPVTDQLTVSVLLKASTTVRIDIFTITGEMIYSGVNDAPEGRSAFLVPFTGLTEGMYVVKIHSEDGINVVRRVIKSR